MNNYKMFIEYDGGRYDGWQRMGKDDSTNTVERKIVEVLEKMTGEQIEIFCGCRTEKGVHANCQVANFKTQVNLKDYEIRNYLNRYLPRDIAVFEVKSVDERFHSQLNAQSKTYLYKIDTNDIASVFDRKYKYHSFTKLDTEAMEKAAQIFLGEHDFVHFTSAKKSKSTVKRIEDIVIEDELGDVNIYITANDFLHNMARIIIGTLIDVGRGIKSSDDIKGMLDGTKDVSLPAESHALYLDMVNYKA